jgi:hypothetical protein
MASWFKKKRDLRSMPILILWNDCLYNAAIMMNTSSVYSVLLNMCVLKNKIDFMKFSLKDGQSSVTVTSRQAGLQQVSIV